jgi:hypothetical protein
MQIDLSKVTPDMSEKMKEIMKETALPLDKPPTKLFHATSTSNTTSILENGLKPHEHYGEIYFCEKEKDCLKFVKKPCVIFEIHLSYIDMAQMFISREAKQFQSFQYYKEVPKEAIKNWRVHT